VRFSPSEVLQAAEVTGFGAGIVEKVLHLLNLLNAFNSHPFLKGKKQPSRPRSHLLSMEHAS